MQLSQKVDPKCFESWERNDFYVLPWLPCTNASNNFPNYNGIWKAKKVSLLYSIWLYLKEMSLVAIDNI